MSELHICCICGKLFKGFGNNPAGAAWKTPSGNIELPKFGPEDRCCDECDGTFVISGRLYRMQLAKEQEVKC